MIAAANIKAAAKIKALTSLDDLEATLATSPLKLL
jgi:hypothetical protein